MSAVPYLQVDEGFPRVKGAGVISGEISSRLRLSVKRLQQGRGDGPVVHELRDALADAVQLLPLDKQTEAAVALTRILAAFSRGRVGVSPVAAAAESLLAGEVPTATTFRRNQPASISAEIAADKIRQALQRRSGRPWKVRIATGRVAGWVVVTAPDERARYDSEGHEVEDGEPGLMGSQDIDDLAQLLDLESGVGPRGVMIPAGPAYYLEFVDRAEGRCPAVYGDRQIA